MQMLLLLLVAGMIGYLLSNRDRGFGFQERLETSDSWLQGVYQRVMAPPLEMQLKNWVLGDGARYFPREFRDWFADLTGNQARKFTQGLFGYLEGLGYKPYALCRGALDHQPERVTDHAQAILSYSQVYRQAKQVQREH
jgi:hypothetical protein